MNRGIRLLFTLGLLLITTHRLPAPISEIPQITPTTKPKREATHVSKPKPEATPKAKATPALRFAGTWSGTTFDKVSNGSTGSSTYIIHISDDEKTVWMERYQAPCNRFRDTLTWSMVFPKQVFTHTLRLNANGTASFVSEGKWTSGDNAGITQTHTGVFSRQ